MMDIEKLTDDIIQLLSLSESPIRLNEIAKSLKIKSDSAEYQELKQLLENLSISDILERVGRGRYQLKESYLPPTVIGKYIAGEHRSYVNTDQSHLSMIRIDRGNKYTALDGDIVRVQLLAQKANKKPIGEIIEIIERKKQLIVGMIEFDGNFHFLIPDDSKYQIDFLIPERQLKSSEEGDKVSVELLEWKDPHKNPTAKVVRIMGKAGIPAVEYDSVVEEFDLPLEFPHYVVSEAKLFKPPRDQKTYADRIDLRNKTIITIDPVDAKDFDDALSLDILENGNYYLGVHIADVSHYVTENSELDNEARYRGTSVYLVDKVIPMLPEELSNEICSLKQNEVRFTYSVFIELSKTGIVKNYELAETVIKSDKRFNYHEVQEIIEGKKNEFSELILGLFEVSTLLNKRRFMEGGIKFNTKEVKFKLDSKKYPISVELRKTTPATSLVEECMLIANKVVASHVDKLTKQYRLNKALPFIYRIHEQVDQSRLSEAITFFNSIGLRVSKKALTSKELNDILEDIKDTEIESIVNRVLIRTMSKAIYSKKNIGHFGLGFEYYTHFTSPIRRYPDLVVHRLMKEYNKKKPDNDRLKELSLFLGLAASHSSEKERSAMEAERASSKLTHTVMAKSHIGEEYEGTITGVTSYGLFVEIDGLYAEGLLHIKDLMDDYYIYDDKKFCLIGRVRKKVFRFGSRIKVKLINANIKKRTIDLAYIKE